MKYDYKIIRQTVLSEKELTFYGQEGWEIEHIYVSNDSRGTVVTTYWLKKTIKT